MEFGVTNLGSCKMNMRTTPKRSIKVDLLNPCVQLALQFRIEGVWYFACFCTDDVLKTVEVSMPIRLPPKVIFARMKTYTPHYVREERHRCLNTAGAVLCPRLFQTSNSTSQTRKPALPTSTLSDSLHASFAAIVNNTKALVGRHILSLVASPFIVAAPANGTLASLPGQLCTGVSNRSAPGFGQPFS